MGETVDDHDGFVMWVVDAHCFDDAMWLWWDADMMRPTRLVEWTLWLLFYNATFAFGLGGLAGTGRCDLAGLHEFADVSGCC